MPHLLELLDARIPAWERASLTRRNCPLCQSEGDECYVRPDQLHIRHCSVCDCYFISPSPTAGELSTLYSNYYSHHRGSEFQQYYDDPVLVREMFALDPKSDLRARTLSSLMRLEGKRVLDAGFGMGQNLLLMKKLGADVAGIDLDPDAVEFARNVLHIENVRQVDIMTLSNTGVYDLITLHDVIEHPLDPMNVLNKAKSLLSPDGLLSIWTPNASFVNRELQPVVFRVDLEHMQYLTSKACHYIADSLNMTIVYLNAHGFPKLESIQRMSEGKGGTGKQMLRSLVRSFPGFVQVNTLRKRFAQRNAQSGDYHLFCVLKNRVSTRGPVDGLAIDSHSSIRYTVAK